MLKMVRSTRWQFFHNVATVGLDSLRSICPNIALETPVASASRERLQPRCWRSCLSVADKKASEIFHATPPAKRKFITCAL